MEHSTGECSAPIKVRTVSALRNLISNYVAPEPLYLEAHWSSLVPYTAAAGLLTYVLPIASGANRTTVREHALRVAERAKVELGEERPCFIDGCPAEWQAARPVPGGGIVAALDGGYVRGWEDQMPILDTQSEQNGSCHNLARNGPPKSGVFSVQNTGSVGRRSVGGSFRY